MLAYDDDDDPDPGILETLDLTDINAELVHEHEVTKREIRDGLLYGGWKLYIRDAEGRQWFIRSTPPTPEPEPEVKADRDSDGVPIIRGVPRDDV